MTTTKSGRRIGASEHAGEACDAARIGVRCTLEDLSCRRRPRARKPLASSFRGSSRIWRHLRCPRSRSSSSARARHRRLRTATRPFETTRWSVRGRESRKRLHRFRRAAGRTQPDVELDAPRSRRRLHPRASRHGTTTLHRAPSKTSPPKLAEAAALLQCRCGTASELRLGLRVRSTGAGRRGATILRTGRPTRQQGGTANCSRDPRRDLLHADARRGRTSAQRLDVDRLQRLSSRLPVPAPVKPRATAASRLCAAQVPGVRSAAIGQPPRLVASESSLAHRWREQRPAAIAPGRRQVGRPSAEQVVRPGRTAEAPSPCRLGVDGATLDAPGVRRQRWPPWRGESCGPRPRIAR